MTSNDPVRQRADQLLDRAAADGAFDDVAGAGRGIDLPAENSFVPDELRGAYRVMEMAGVAPGWVSLAHDIELAIRQARRHLRAHQSRMKRARTRLSAGKAADFARQFRDYGRLHLEARLQFETRLAEIGRLIERHNALAPGGAHRFVFWPPAELAAFDACWPWAPPRRPPGD